MTGDAEEVLAVTQRFSQRASLSHLNIAIPEKMKSKRSFCSVIGDHWPRCVEWRSPETSALSADAAEQHWRQ